MKQRNGMIDMLRVVFTLYVIIAHMKSAYGIDYPYPVNGWYSVEFFFVLSGCLLAASCARAERNGNRGPLGGYTILWRRIGSMYPIWVTGLLCYIVIYLLQNKLPLTSLPGVVADSYPAFLMLSSLGLPSEVTIPYSWYIPTMLLAMAMLLLWMTRDLKWFNRCAAPLIALSGYCWMWRKYGHIVPLDEDWLGITYGKTVRALSDMCVGCMAFEAGTAINERLAGRLTRTGKALMSAIGSICVAVPMYWIMFSLPHERQILGVLLLGAGIAIVFSDAWALSGYLDRPAFVFLGRYSYALYLGQGVPNKLLATYYGTVPLRTFAAVYLLLAVLSGLGIYLLSKALMAAVRYIRRRIGAAMTTAA